MIAVSTEDGRIIFYSTQDAQNPTSSTSESPIANAVAKAQLNTKSTEGTSRIKDFEILGIPGQGKSNSEFFLVSGSSNGEVQVWKCSVDEIAEEGLAEGDGQGKSNGVAKPKHIGRLLGAYETGNRITCLRAYVMNDPDEDEDDSFEDFDTQGEGSDDDSSGSDEA